MERSLTVAALFDLAQTIAAALFEGKTYPWEILDGIGDFIRALGPTLREEEYERRGADVWIARDARIDPSAHIAGPTIVDHGAEVRHCAFMRGGAIVGRDAVVGNSTELKNCLLFNGAQVPHFNYVGDSILGHRAHLGAGAVTSNVKSDKSPVCVHGPNESLATGRKKCGAMVGDFAEVGCNSVLNPGCVLGRRASVYPTSCVRGTVPEDSIYKRAGEIVLRTIGR